jgi:hypothetical protein
LHFSSLLKLWAELEAYWRTKNQSMHSGTHCTVRNVTFSILLNLKICWLSETITVYLKLKMMQLLITLWIMKIDLSIQSQSTIIVPSVVFSTVYKTHPPTNEWVFVMRDIRDICFEKGKPIIALIILFRQRLSVLPLNVTFFVPNFFVLKRVSG